MASFSLQPSASIADQHGFTLIELVMIIVLLAIVSVVAVVKWPTGMDEEAAVREFKRALRYAQHLAMTREWNPDGSQSWGLTVSNNAYTISSRDGNSAGTDFSNRHLLGNSAITLTAGTVLFNGLGAPIAADASLLTTTPTFTINGSRSLTVCLQTGYVVEGGSCP